MARNEGLNITCNRMKISELIQNHENIKIFWKVMKHFIFGSDALIFDPINPQYD